MPLITISGLPSSGKSKICNELQTYFANRIQAEGINMQVKIIDDNSFQNDRLPYDSPTSEKRLRGHLLAGVERTLNKQTLVICDSCNYIKGFRYQLYCVARAIGTTHCVVQVMAKPSDVLAWNETSPNPYTKETIENLITRYEEPIGSNRWDSPLFPVMSTDGDIQFEKIWEAIINGTAPPPNQSTVVNPVASTNFLSELNTSCQNVMDDILGQQNLQGGGLGRTKLPKCALDVDFEGRNFSEPQLNRLKIKFISTVKSQHNIPIARIPTMFVSFLQNN